MRKKNVEIISLIYKSVDYLDFIVDQLQGESCKVPGWDVGIRIVANDANERVIERLRSMDISFSLYNDPNPDDFYLNRVYRAWNFAGISSEYDNLCFVNSDMAFSPNWLDNLLKHHDGENIPCSRLIESGKMTSGMYGLSKDCGKTPSQFNSSRFQSFCNTVSENTTKEGGLFMPCVFEKDKFIESGMYPEGNIFLENGKLICGYPNDRRVYMSGDKFYFHMLNRKYGMNHLTVFDSLVYHIQEGEMDE